MDRTTEWQVPSEWHPSPEEVARIREEMRPIVAEFARRSELQLASFSVR
jgi:hypothetical protein